MTSTEELGRIVCARADLLCRRDLQDREEAVHSEVAGRRVLVIGGAGSIGSRCVLELAGRGPAALDVVDHNENGLARLVRLVRSSPGEVAATPMRTFPIDYGSTLMERLVLREAPYDVVMNLAALKHVRSEKDELSLLQMLDTNVVRWRRLLGWIAARGGARRVFSVSTDKAANPTNLMGATKRLMEHVLFSPAAVGCARESRASARFANVAFSDGSLLASWLERIAAGQALSVPEGTRRYFISMEESGRICLLGCACAPSGSIVIPRFDPGSGLQLLEDVLARVLARLGLEPVWCRDESEARARVEADRRQGRYPVLVTPLDTSGEKNFEEFVGHRESAIEVGMSDLRAVRYVDTLAGDLDGFLREVEDLLTHPSRAVSKESIVHRMNGILGELRHRETGRSLDERM